MRTTWNTDHIYAAVAELFVGVALVLLVLAVRSTEKCDFIDLIMIQFMQDFLKKNLFNLLLSSTTLLCTELMAGKSRFCQIRSEAHVFSSKGEHTSQ